MHETRVLTISAGIKSGPGFHARYFQLKNFDRTRREAFVEARRGAYTAYVLLPYSTPNSKLQTDSEQQP